MLKLILWLYFLCNFCCAYKILAVFPMPTKSHTILGEGYVRNLLNAGHEVTYITPIPMKNPSPKLRQINVESNFAVFPSSQVLDFGKLINKEVDLMDLNLAFSMMLLLTNATITHAEVQKLIQDPNERFDVVIAEWMFSDLYCGFASVFGCPLIWSSSTEPHAMVLSLIDEDPNPAYTVNHMHSNNIPPFTFWQRAYELYLFLRVKYIRWTLASLENESFEKAYGAAVAKRGRTLPSFQEVKYNASLMLGNSHVSLGHAVRLPQNYIPIAGYFIENVTEPLPEDLQKIMDSAANGVIYFSMGTVLKSNSLPDEVQRDLLATFGSLKQTVIWKYEDAMSELPNNVHIVNWAPQQSILAHPNCALFITHGGLLSTTEAVYRGVPIVGVPGFGDQFNNVNIAVTKGFAKRVDIGYDMASDLKVAIADILENPRYREKVKELSFIYHHRPVPPGQELVHWVEHVVRTRGAPHLRSPALHVPLYQKLFLDVAAVFLIITAIVYVILKRVFRVVIKIRGRKEKVN